MKSVFSLLRGRPAGQLIVQISDACNATCPQCELRATSAFPRSRLPMDDVKRMIDHAAANGFQALSFTGGEPFLQFDALVELINHACRAGIPYVRTGTNAFFLRDTSNPAWETRVRRIVEALAATNLYTLWISLDSAYPEVHEEMRGLRGVVRGIERALPIFHESGIYPAANLGINRNVGGRWTPPPQRPTWTRETAQDFHYTFHRAFHRFYRRTIDLGFTMTNTCYPMSVETQNDRSLDAVYGASSTASIINFTPAEKAVLFRCLSDVIPRFRDRIRVFTPLCSLNALTRHYESGTPSHYPCRGGAEYFFVDAKHGHTYPCGFRGNQDLGPFWEMRLKNENRTPHCRKCDWECYRDPSEMLGPIYEMRDSPMSAIRRLRNDPEFTRLWWNDMRYHRACGWFSGRTAPRYESMKPFGPQASETLSHAAEAYPQTQV